MSFFSLAGPTGPARSPRSATGPATATGPTRTSGRRQILSTKVPGQNRGQFPTPPHDDAAFERF
jgi:hypothetical protein